MKYFLKYYQYSKERFPLQKFIPLSVIFAASACAATQAYLYGEIKRLSLFILSFFAVLLFFFRLRLFDEFKDFQHDLRYYPHRPVPRGLVTLKELSWVALIVMILEIIIALNQGSHSRLLFLVALIYSLLMFKEFFVSKYLRDHFTVYIASHEVLIFPLFFYIFSLNGFLADDLKRKFFWFLIFFLGSQLFLLEVVRKIRARELEGCAQDTYTAQYGVKGVSFLIVFLGICTLLFGSITGNILFGKITVGWLGPLIIMSGLIFFIFRFVRQPTQNAAKNIFKVSILFVLVVNTTFVINIILNL